MKENNFDNPAGFFFAMFQPDVSRNRVKVWLDGEENYRFMSPESFVDLVKEEGKPAMRRALMDASFFLWDVEGDRIQRLSFREDPEQLRKFINEHVDKEAEEHTIAERYWKTNQGLVNDSVQIKV